MQDPNKSFFDEEKQTEAESTPAEPVSVPTPDPADGEEGQVRIPRTATDPLPPRNNGENLATISMVLALASILCCGLPASIGAIVTALLARHYMGKFNGASLVGLVVGIFTVLLSVFMIVMTVLIMSLIEDVIGEGGGSSLLFLPFWR